MKKMIRSWNKTGRIKAIIIGLLALPNIFFPIERQEQHGLEIIITPLIFALLAVPLIILINKAICRREIIKTNWNDNPLNFKYPLVFSHFSAILFLGIGFSLLLGTSIKFQEINNLGLSSFLFGLGIIIGNFIVLNWKKLGIIYIIFGVIGLATFIVYLFLFEIRNYTKNEDIIKHFTEKLELYKSTTDIIIEQIDSISFNENTKYTLNAHGKPLTFFVLQDYIFREKTVELSKQKEKIIDSLLQSIDCKYMEFVDNKFLKFRTNIINWHLFHIKISKVIDDNILNKKNKNWELVKTGDLPTKNKNWLYHIEDNWYIESRTSKRKITEVKYPFEDDFDLKEYYEYSKAKRLKCIGRYYHHEEKGETHKLKHGRWKYLDTNEYILNEEVYCYDTLKELINYNDSTKRKILKDTVTIKTKSLFGGEWEEKKDIKYVLD